MTRHHDVHIVPRTERRVWHVRQGGRTVSIHYALHTAVRRGKQRARRDRVELVTHGINGRIRSKDSYGNESPRPDTER